MKIENFQMGEKAHFVVFPYKGWPLGLDYIIYLLCNVKEICFVFTWVLMVIFLENH